MAAPLVDSNQVDRNLHHLHYEILRLQNECNLRNLSCFQIRKAASSFFSQQQQSRNRLKTFVIVSSILTCLLAAVIYVEPVSRFTIYMRRQILLKASIQCITSLIRLRQHSFFGQFRFDQWIRLLYYDWKGAENDHRVC